MLILCVYPHTHKVTDSSRLHENMILGIYPIFDIYPETDLSTLTRERVVSSWRSMDAYEH